LGAQTSILREKDMTEHIKLTRNKGVATITLNRPEQHNTIDYKGWVTLKEMADDLDETDDRIVVITGAGEKAFSSGADIKDFERYLNSSEKAKVYEEALKGAMDSVESLSKPTICLIKGICMGGGCLLSTAADLRIASENSRFAIPAARLSVLIDHSQMKRLVDLIGRGNASHLLLTGNELVAAEAYRMGLVNFVYPLSEIDDVVCNLAEKMSRLAPLTQKWHKRMMRTVLDNPSLTGIPTEEIDMIFKIVDSKDFREGRRAFQEKRKPQFKGK
jgi:enoyl-CoA hydratase/carnithine racemase